MEGWKDGGACFKFHQMPPLQNVKANRLKIDYSVWEVSVGFVKYLMYRSAYLHLTAHETNDLTPELSFNSGSIGIKRGFLFKQIGHLLFCHSPVLHFI